MPFKVKSYKRLENRDTIEVYIQNGTVNLGGLARISGLECPVYFNGKLCYVPRLCQIMDETECDGMRLEVVDGKSFYFTLDESLVHSWTTGNPSSLQHSVWRRPYVAEEFTLAVKHLLDSRSRANGTYFGDDKTRVYLNGKRSLAWPDIFLEGNKVKKISWHWYYYETMDKYVKRLSEVWFVNADVVDLADVRAVPNPTYDINVLKARLNIKPEDTNAATYIKNTVELNSRYGITPVGFIPYDPSEFEFKPNINKEEKEMKKEINAQAVWNSMSKAQQELCCDLIGNAAKGKISEEIKMAVINTKINRYSGKVRGEDIRDIIFNGPATIILWRDGTKTVVKQQKSDKWDPEKAVALAVMKKTFGTNATGSDYLDYVKPYIEKAYEDEKKRKAAARQAIENGGTCK